MQRKDSIRKLAAPEIEQVTVSDTTIRTLKSKRYALLFMDKDLKMNAKDAPEVFKRAPKLPSGDIKLILKGLGRDDMSRLVSRDKKMDNLNSEMTYEAIVLVPLRDESDNATSHIKRFVDPKELASTNKRLSMENLFPIVLLAGKSGKMQTHAQCVLLSLKNVK